MQLPIVFQPIGYVNNDVEEMGAPEEIAGRKSRIIIEKHLADGLLGMDTAEHVLVVFYFHRADHVRLRLHPRDDTSRPLRGVFGTRTQYRPNPIGVTVARLIQVEGNELMVQGLDAMNGTPILDIKPYAPAFDDVTGNDEETPG